MQARRRRPWRRCYVGTVRRACSCSSAEALSQRISAAYAQGESSPRWWVSEVRSDADLARMMRWSCRAVEDLLEAADDAPIIRLLNALLTQAARDGASDIHIEPYETPFQRALSRRRRALREVVQPTARCTALDRA